MSLSRFHHCKRYAILLAGLLLTGCASYHPHPLPSAPDLAKAPQLTVPVKQFHLRGLAPHNVSPHGLDATTVMLLAVMHNPQLKAARLQAGVASAQVLQAGLLPNPELNASFASSARDYGGGLALDEQIRSWITRGALRSAARAKQKQVNLTILWQEWQVAGQAQQLFIQVRSGVRLHHLFLQSETLLEGEYKRDRRAMLRGDALTTTVSSDLAVLNAAESNLRQLQIQQNLSRHKLNALLGLQPQVRLHLIGSPHVHALTTAAFKNAITALPHRRPDLLALQAGYQSQEENVRAAILGQFPAMTAGVAVNRDPIEGVNSFGPHVTLSLPLFNHNQGKIAIQRATRAVLRQTYQARLDAAVGQADQVRQAIIIQRREQKEFSAQIAVLQKAAAAARRSLIQNNLNASAYVKLESGLLGRRAEALRLHASIEGSRATLRMLLGLPY